eukprot:TRINITY_DN48464_c0_g1_i1.p1 TRINITY_DN48464_c0_g1~~TRINITY_DN48464_c0_g1_i1.p1  ORF type:complete len:1206 (+),score=208.96 TRINITY_DN48464_c0_g1_i1:125-3742(+)
MAPLSGFANSPEMNLITYGGEMGLVHDDPVYLLLRSARAGDVGADGGEPAEPDMRLTVMPFNTWQMVKRQIKERWPGLRSVPDNYIRLLHKSMELRSACMVSYYFKDGGTVNEPVELRYLIIDHGHGGATSNGIGLYVDCQVPCTQSLRKRVEASLAAMLTGIQPRLTEDGTGATYMLKDPSNRHVLAVVKPKDEEAFAPQNPRGYVGQENSIGLRNGVYSTQQAAREVAAFIVDHGRFAGVPDTALVHCRHPKFVKANNKVVWKIAAFQTFVDVNDTAGNFAPQVFAVPCVHRIGILDIRIVNLDRNDGNLLIRRSRSSHHQRYELVPIDHGLSMPDRLEVYTDDIAWMSWPQAHQPFGEKELEYISSLNGPRDAQILARSLGIRRECLRLMEVTTKLLKIGAKHGLTLYDIGTIMYREDRGSDIPVQKSALEQIINNSLDLLMAIAADGLGRGSTSSTLSGLDLHTTRTMSFGCHKAFKRQSSSAADKQVARTPQLGPSSPLSSPLSTSPHAMEMPPHLALDGRDSDDLDTDHSADDGGEFGSLLSTGRSAAGRSGTKDRQAAETQGGREVPGGEENSKPADQGHKHEHASAARWHLEARQQFFKGGGTLSRVTRGSTASSLVAAHRERDGKDVQGSIFGRPGLTPSDWTPGLEKAFRHHLTAALLDHVKRKFKKSPLPETRPTDDSPRESSDLKSAFPSFLPSESDDFFWHREEPEQDVEEEHQLNRLELGSRQAYVPPQLRNRLPGLEEDESPAHSSSLAPPLGSDADAPSGASVESRPAVARYVPPQRRAAAEAAARQEGSPSVEAQSAEVSRPKYVPPFLRRGTMAEAETGADGARVASDDAIKSPASPTAQVCLLPTDDSGGNSRYGFCLCQGQRATMEDAVDAIADLDCEIPTEFYAVLDGHGGSEAVEFVKQRLPVLIREHGSFGDRDKVGDVLSETFVRLDEELLELVRRNDRTTLELPREVRPLTKTHSVLDIRDVPGAACRLSSGCVACIALLRGKSIHVSNLGDCRAVVCCGGEAKALTEDHRPDVEAEHQRLSKFGVEVSSDGYMHGQIGVSRAFGDWDWNKDQKCLGLLCTPDVFDFEIGEETEFLLLACDGIFEKMSTKEVVQIVRRSLRMTGNPKEAAETLIKHATKRNSSDNLSALVVLFKLPPKTEERSAPRLFRRTTLAALEAQGESKEDTELSRDGDASRAAQA